MLGLLLCAGRVTLNVYRIIEVENVLHSSKAILPGKAKAILKRMNLLMSSRLLADGRITFDLSN